MCTSARNLGCHSAQDCYVYLWNELCWIFLINLFCCIVCKCVWIFCAAQVEGAAQWLPRANINFMLVSRQIPAKSNKLILSYLIFTHFKQKVNVMTGHHFICNCIESHYRFQSTDKSVLEHYSLSVWSRVARLKLQQCSKSLDNLNLAGNTNVSKGYFCDDSASAGNLIAWVTAVSSGSYHCI